MNSRQLQLAVLLGEMRSFSQVAEHLSISQPALSKQIIALEQDLGLKLFDRSTTPLSLTPAGEFFVQKARHLLWEEDQLVKTMERYKSGESGRLTIGISPFRSLYLMPAVIRQLKERFPGIQVVLAEQASAQLHKGITEGLYDFAIVNLPVDESILDVIPLEEDVLMLALPNKMLSLLPPSDFDSRTQIDFGECARLPFIALSPGQEMRLLFDKLCAMTSVTPEIHVEVVGMATAWTMVQSGIGAAILPGQFIRNSSDGNITLFELKQSVFIRQPAIVTRHGQYLSPYAEYAIRLLREMNR